MATFDEHLELETPEMQLAIFRVAELAETHKASWEVFRAAGVLITEAWDEAGTYRAECERLRTKIIDIRELAHGFTSGPSNKDGYWQIREMANKAVLTP